MTVRHVRSLYLDQMRRDLTRYGMDQPVPVGWARGFSLFKDRNLMLVRKQRFDQHKRDLGLDWPADAETMIGMGKSDDLQHCVEDGDGRADPRRSSRMRSVAGRGLHLDARGFGGLWG